MPLPEVDPRFLPDPGKQRTAIHDPELKRLRAIKMMEARVAGYSNTEVSRMFQVSVDTVERVLSYAKRANILAERSDAILQRLLPLSEDAIVEALKAKDVDPVARAQIALKVYEGTGLMGPKASKGEISGGDDELSRAMKELRAKAKELEDTSEGELVSGLPQRLIADGTSPQAAGAVGENIQEPSDLPSGAAENGAEPGPPTPALPEKEDSEPHSEGGPAQSE